MLAGMNEIFAAVPERAVCGFNVFSFEDAAMVTRAAEDTGTPVFLMANKIAVKHMGFDMFAVMCGELAKKASVPISVHLDHSPDYESVKAAIEAGFTSVMFDGSSLPPEENAEITKKIVSLAHGKGVSVEAEIGHVRYMGAEDPLDTVYTSPEDAKWFAEETGVDALAVSIGTVHRMVTQDAVLRFDLLEKIKAAVDTPLVIHGSTGVSDEDIIRLSRGGARKINIGTALRQAFGNTLREQVAANPDVFDRITLFKEPMRAVYEKAVEKIKLVNS